MHNRIQSGEKPCTRDVRKYVGNQKSNLITDKTKHNGENPFRCDVCYYACDQKRNLFTHT